MTIQPGQTSMMLILTMLSVLLVLPAAAGEGEGAEGKKSSEASAGEAPTPEPASNVYMRAVGAKAGKTEDSEVKVYTNADLGKLVGTGKQPPKQGGTSAEPPAGGATTPTPPAEQKAWDPLTEMEEQQKAQAERRTAIAEAEQAVIAAEERVAAVEKRIHAIRNPFLARPDAPKENADDWNTIGAEEQVDRSEKELAEAQKALEAAREHLTGLRR